MSPNVNHYNFWRRRKLAVQNRNSREDQRWEKEVRRIEFAKVLAAKEHKCLTNHFAERKRVTQIYRDNNDARVQKIDLCKRVVSRVDADYRKAALENLKRKDEMVSHNRDGSLCKKFDRVPRNNWPSEAGDMMTQKPRYKSVMSLSACQKKWPSVVMEQDKFLHPRPAYGKAYDIWATL